MTDKRTTPRYAMARAIAQAVASLRQDPPPGLETLSDTTWELVHSIAWSMKDGLHVATVETMRLRRRDGRRAIVSAPVPRDHACWQPLETAWTTLSAELPSSALSARVMVAFPGWEVVADEGDAVTSWDDVESLALSSSEWSDFIVQRDADDRERGLVAANAMLRVAHHLERSVAEHPDGYHRHWTRVDAEILRRAALREHPSLDPDFTPAIRLVA